MDARIMRAARTFHMTQTTPEMVERLAEAIYSAPNGIDGDSIATALWETRLVDDLANTAGQAREVSMQICRAAAAAALEAMVDPTDDMLIPLQHAAGAHPGPVFMNGSVGAWVWACGVAAALGRPVPPSTGRIYEPARLPEKVRAVVDAALQRNAER